MSYLWIQISPKKYILTMQNALLQCQRIQCTCICLFCLFAFTTNICFHISLYIVNYWECFKIIIAIARNHQLKTRLLPFFMLMQRRFVKCNFIDHHRWNGRESTNQLWQHISYIKTLYFLFHRLLIPPPPQWKNLEKWRIDLEKSWREISQDH